MRTNNTKNEIDEIKKLKEKIKGKDLKYETKKHIYEFQQYETIRSFGESIYNCKVNKFNMDEREMHQSNLLKNMVECNDKSKPGLKKVRKKTNTQEMHMLSMKVEN